MTDVAVSPTKKLLSKVPEITAFFWIIKILCTTVGETAADFLNFNLNLGLAATSFVMALVLVIVLAIQIGLRRYIPGVYWLVVVFISVVGTLLTDNLTDNLGVPLLASSLVFGAALAVVFGIWYYREKTLSIHSITSRAREGYYWLAVLLTFALGTAVGDLVAEKLSLGYLVSLLLFGSMIVIILLLSKFTRISKVLLFWLAYILTRPLGASAGDLLAQSPHDGGIGLGTTLTSVLFLGLILVLVGYLAITRKGVLSHE